MRRRAPRCSRRREPATSRTISQDFGICRNLTERLAERAFAWHEKRDPAPPGLPLPCKPAVRSGRRACERDRAVEKRPSCLFDGGVWNTIPPNVTRRS